jgi:cyclophilin family peptidyl-prolyl cis-trans isomerase
MKRFLRTSLVFLLCALTLAACGGGEQAAPTTPAEPETAEGKQGGYKQAPAMQIDPSKTYHAAVKTSKGEFTMELFAADAPITVNSFVFLAREGFYEGISFHRIVPDFVIQTGDPTGTGMGGPGYEFEDELNGPHEYGPGIVAMANAGPNTNGSQFFIGTGEWSKSLNEHPNYTIFGKVIEGMDTVLAIGKTPVNGEAPTEKITIESISIHES